MGCAGVSARLSPGLVRSLRRRLGVSLRLADSFINNRKKLLDVVSSDVWLQEFLNMLHELRTCPSCHAALDLPARAREKIRQKIVGAGRPTTVEVKDFSRAEGAKEDGEAENGLTATRNSRPGGGIHGTMSCPGSA